MRPFTYEVARDVHEAVSMMAGDPDAEFLAGGTSQVDLMKEGVQRPRRLVDISQLGLDTIEMTDSGGWRIGANVKNAAIA